MQTITESAGSSTAPQDSGGFRIEVSPDKLSVIKTQQTRRGLSLFLTYAAGACWLLLRSPDRLLLSVVLLLVLGIGIARYFCGADHNLQCTREYLELVDVVRGRVRQTRQFTRAEVERIHFGTVRQSQYGSTGGLIFNVAGKRIKTLYGLKCVEAQRIIDQLQRLGFDVWHDPGMPMMVEIELSRRRSWLGRWLF